MLIFGTTNKDKIYKITKYRHYGTIGTNYKKENRKTKKKRTHKKQVQMYCIFSASRAAIITTIYYNSRD